MKVWDVTISGHEGTKYHKGVLLEDIKESINEVKDEIVENDIYTADEIFRIINKEFAFSEQGVQEN